MTSSLPTGLEWRKAYRSAYYFDERAAARAVRFAEHEMQHIKGEFAGHRFILEPWERKLIRRVFGWMRRDDNTRKYRYVYIFIPRKTGKSFLGAFFALYLTFADKEPGAEVVSAAADSEQAALVFEVARENVIRNPKLRSLSGKTYRRSIVVRETASSYKVLSAVANTKHGSNLSGVIIDELHAQPNRELVDVLTTATGARRQPLVVYLTTAGYDMKTICGEIHNYADQVRRRIVNDPSFLPVMYGADKDDDWRDRKTWYKANPNLGVSVKEDYIRSHCERAIAIPSYENTFKRLYLNIWTQQDERWLPMDKWDQCSGPVNEQELLGANCWGGIDLSAVRDIAAMVLLFPHADGHLRVLPRFWVPKETALDRQRRGNVPYHDWIQRGFIVGTEGNAIDFDFIKKDVLELAQKYSIQELAIDRLFNAHQISMQLAGEGMKIIPFGQGYFSMSAPSKQLETLLLHSKLSHGGNEVLRWMASNVGKEENAAGDIKPSKDKSGDKIDGIVSLVMAIGRLMVNDISGSVYNQRGLVLL